MTRRGAGVEPIGILETGKPPAGLVARYGSYVDMVQAMVGQGYATRAYDVQGGDLPARPEDHRAYVITGSSAGVYDRLAWIAPLQAFIRAAHGRVKLVGLCFGHQVMASALGGRVEKSGKGWGLGLHPYEVVVAAPWMTEAPRRIAVAASHQDQVVAAPDGATVLAASAFTPFAALAYAGGESISVQFHPEFSHALAAELVTLRAPALPPGLAAQALASLEGPGDAPLIGRWIRGFIGAPPASA